MKILKLGYYEEAYNNEGINQLMAEVAEKIEPKTAQEVASVCHYFPKSSLLSIVENKRFFFSDIKFLNDISEAESLFDGLERHIHLSISHTYSSKTMDVFKDILQMRTKMDNDIRFDASGDINEEDDFIFNRRNYVFCCSLDNDCLSNWKYYGKGDGYE